MNGSTAVSLSPGSATAHPVSPIHSCFPFVAPYLTYLNAPGHLFLSRIKTLLKASLAAVFVPCLYLFRFSFSFFLFLHFSFSFSFFSISIFPAVLACS